MSYLFFLILFSWNLFAQTSEVENQKQVFKTTITYLIDNKKYKEAFDLISKNRKKRPEDQELIRLQGLVLYLDKNYKKANAYFKEASEKTSNSEKAINLYLLAQSKIKLNDIESAANIIRSMGDIPSVHKYSEMALNELKSKGSIPEFVPHKENSTNNSNPINVQPSSRKKYGSMVSMVGGMDTNPVFIPDYSQTSNKARSYFTSVNSSTIANVDSTIGEFNNSFNLGYTYYAEEVAQAFNNLRFNFSTLLNPSSDYFRKKRITFSNSFDRSYQANKKFDYYFTSDNLTAKKEFLTTQNQLFALSLTSGFRTYANKTLTDAADDRSGFSYTMRGIYKYSKDDWAWIHSVGAYKQDTFGGRFNTVTMDYGTNFQKILAYDLEAMISFSIMRIKYLNSPIDREDVMSSYGAEFGREIPRVPGLHSKLSFSRTKNNSDLKQSTYTQDIYSLWVTYELF